MYLVPSLGVSRPLCHFPLHAFFYVFFLPIDNFYYAKALGNYNQIQQAILDVIKIDLCQVVLIIMGIRIMLECMVHHGPAMTIQSAFPHMICPLHNGSFRGQVVGCRRIKIKSQMCLYYGWILHSTCN